MNTPISDRNGLNRKKTGIHKFAFISLLLSMIIGVSACQMDSTATTQVSTANTLFSTATDPSIKPNYLSSYALAQKVAEAINEPDQIAALFQSIPDRQRPALLLDDFVQYIALLRRGVSGSITALTRIDATERAALLGDLRYGANLKYEGFYLHYRQSGKQPETIAYFLQLTEEGMPYLDQLPITKALAMMNYAALYFDAIDRFDRDALSVLISSQSETRGPRLLKADRILTYYRSEIATASPSFRVSSVVPDRIIFEQQVFVDPEKTRIGNRTMTIFADGAAGFMIKDPIPDPLVLADLRIVSKSKMLFDLGTLVGSRIPQVTSSHVEPVTGSAILHNDSTCHLLENGNRDMTAYYNGLILEGIGKCDQHRFWRVDLKAVTLTDAVYSLGSGLSVGDSLDALLLRYPFIDETDGQVERTIGNYRLIARFDISSQTISRITITVNGG